MQTNTQTTQKNSMAIYANRMDNGDTNSGDGWRSRGGGILQSPLVDTTTHNLEKQWRCPPKKQLTMCVPKKVR